VKRLLVLPSCLRDRHGVAGTNVAATAPVMPSAVLTALLVTASSTSILEPAGPVARGERIILLDALAIMLAIVIPTIIATLAFAWWYRASNTKARYLKDWAYSGRIELIVWSIPTLVILFLGGVIWTGSHQLDPARALSSQDDALEVQVVSLDWKWLFIYPDQHIATVNEVQFPANTPVNFKITSDTVMNVFFIPRLGSQIYAMAGMETQVHLIADQPGVYDGMSTNFSGAGFPDMIFKATASSPADFDAWVAKVKASGNKLGLDNYGELAKPSTKDPVQYFSTVEPVLFAAVLDKYMDKSSGLKMADKICLPTKVVAAASKERAE
jgi:cytochrome o ubiquinol oxidase subunit II